MSLPPAIELIGIDKRFGPVHANNDVSLTVAAGTIHGIVDENGAGKSTLMSILYGFYEADAGEIRVGGRPVAIRNASDAIAAGIGMVHQHFMLVPTFTVLENVMLGAEGSALLAEGRATARAELERLERDYALEVEPDALVGELPVGLQQRVEILKALYRGARILILDEPTGVLTPQETDRLFEILRALKDEGVTVILITHKLREILAITDTVSVMRRGEMVAHRPTSETSREELAELMVGRKVLFQVDKAPASAGAPVLDVAGLRIVDADGVARSTASASKSRPARSSGSPECRATARANCSRHSPASAGSPTAASASATWRSPATGRPTRVPCVPPVSATCRRTATAWAWCCRSRLPRAPSSAGMTARPTTATG